MVLRGTVLVTVYGTDRMEREKSGKKKSLDIR